LYPISLKRKGRGGKENSGKRKGERGNSRKKRKGQGRGEIYYR
jgi:hypothetical protein